MSWLWRTPQIHKVEGISEAWKVVVKGKVVLEVNHVNQGQKFSVNHFLGLNSACFPS
jgi:hypothetical protein